MQEFEEAAEKHQQFESARDAAIAALLKTRAQIDAKIAEVKGWGRVPASTGKKRGRPAKSERTA